MQHTTRRPAVPNGRPVRWRRGPSGRHRQASAVRRIAVQRQRPPTRKRTRPMAALRRARRRHQSGRTSASRSSGRPLARCAALPCQRLAQAGSAGCFPPISSPCRQGEMARVLAHSGCCKHHSLGESWEVSKARLAEPEVGQGPCATWASCSDRASRQSWSPARAGDSECLADAAL